MECVSPERVDQSDFSLMGIKVNFNRIKSAISKTVSHTKKVTRGTSIPGPLTIRCNAHIRCWPKGQGWNARITSVPQKNPKNEIFQGKCPLFEKFWNSVPKAFVMMLKFCRNCLPGSGWNDASFSWQRNKVCKMQFFSAPFRTSLAQGAKSLQGSVPLDPMSPCKIPSQSVPICRSYYQKVILHKYSTTCVWHIT